MKYHLALSWVLILGLAGGLMLTPGSTAVAQTCEPVLVQRLLASNGAHGDNFGCAVSISGDLLVVGASNADAPYEDHGCAYVYRRTGEGWIQEAMLDRATIQEQEYALSVSVSDRWALVGAPERNTMVPDSGGACAFYWEGNEWSLRQVLHAEEDKAHRRFGHPISMYGTQAAIGALGLDDEPGGSAVTVLHVQDQRWDRQATVQGTDTKSGDLFGSAISLSQTRLAIGAPHCDDRGVRSGAVYVFGWDGSQWVQEARILEPGGMENSLFGSAVSMSGDLLAIGAPRYYYGNDKGHTYIYRWDGSDWTMQCDIMISDGFSKDSLGTAVAMSESMCITGGPDHERSTGLAVAYRLDGQQCIEETSVPGPSMELYTYFGSALALEGETLVVGAYRDENEQGVRTGAAYVFDLNCTPPSLTTLGSCPGQMRFKVESATPGARIAYLYADGEGSFEIPPGYQCAGLTLGLNKTTKLASVGVADENGTGRLDVKVPAIACGRVYVQAVDVTTCETSNVVHIE
ncbi:MAG: hypothetical protein HND57_13045 [Planctomycetes bacterium]|nr:hypothetical protein [Planctomycetota bacterium]